MSLASKIAAVERLIDGATTDGEREAARAALERLKANQPAEIDPLLSLLDRCARATAIRLHARRSSFWVSLDEVYHEEEVARRLRS